MEPARPSKFDIEISEHRKHDERLRLLHLFYLRNILKSAFKWQSYIHAKFDQMWQVFVQGNTDKTGDDQVLGDKSDTKGNSKDPNIKPQKLMQIVGQVVSVKASGH